MPLPRRRATAFLSAAALLSGCAPPAEPGRCWVVVESPELPYETPWPHPQLHRSTVLAHRATAVGETLGWPLQVPEAVWKDLASPDTGQAEGLGAIGNFFWGGVGLAIYPVTLAGRAVSYLSGGVLGGLTRGAQFLAWDLPTLPFRRPLETPPDRAPTR